MFTIMSSIILVGLAFVIGSFQPFVENGVVYQRFEDRWLKFEGICSGILFGGMVIAEQLDRILRWGGSDSFAAIALACCFIVIISLLFGVFVSFIAAKSSSVMAHRLSR